MFSPQTVYVRSTVRQTKYTINLLDRLEQDVNLKQVPEDQDRMSVIQQNSPHRHPVLFIEDSRSIIVRPEQHRRRLTARPHTITASPAQGCIYNCEYCYLQYRFKNESFLTITGNFDDFLNKIENQIQQRLPNPTLVNIGENSDFLAVDDLTHYGPKIIEYMSQKSNANLEIRTKSANIDNILGTPNNKDTIIAFSLSPFDFSEKYDHGTASVKNRIKAAKRLQSDGFKIALKFEPIVCRSGWEEAYRNLIEYTFDILSNDQIHHYSLGCLRMNAELRSIVEQRFPSSDISDNLSEGIAYREDLTNYTYPQSTRENLYSTLISMIHEQTQALPGYLSVEEPSLVQKFSEELNQEDADFHIKMSV